MNEKVWMYVHPYAAGATAAVGAVFWAIYQWYLPFNASIEIEAVRGLFMNRRSSFFR